MSHLKYVCVFCGSSRGARPEYAEAARALGQALLRRGLGLVYGGSNVGLMGVLSNTMLEGGGEAIGVMPGFMRAFEPRDDRLTRLIVTDSMHARKAKMAELSDAFIALPGGFGTLEELLEIITHAQIGQHRKPIGLLNAAGYYDPLLVMIDHAVTEGFVRNGHQALVQSSPDADHLLDLLQGYRQPDGIERWMDPEEH